MRIASWNVNSLKVRLPHVLQWLADNPIDILCLQELKMTDDKFPIAELAAAGYQAVFCGQKTYNGVATLIRQELGTPLDVIKNNPLFEDLQQRIISATINTDAGPTRVICVYVPNGQALDSDKYQYKITWLTALHRWLQDEIARYPRLVLLGDFNIAPTDLDVHDPQIWRDGILVSPKERQFLQELISLPLIDAYRALHPDTKQFTWWDYRMMAFRRNHGLRIDHILHTPSLTLQACGVDTAPRKWEQASDHTPIWAEFSA